MENLFSQKSPDQVPTGQDQSAVDANPAPSQTVATRPVWEKFVTNTVATQHNQAAVQAENDLTRQASFDNRHAAQTPEIWKGADGKLLRKVGRQSEVLDAADFVDHPTAGAEARKSLWDREIRTAKRESSDAAFQLRDPAFHAQGLAEKDRKDIETEGSMLPETDPRHVELKQKLIADDAYQAQKKDLAQKSWDSEARALELEATDPETWWQSKRTAEINANRQPIVADAQAQHAQADQAAASAEQEHAAITAQLAQGVTGDKVQALQTRKAEIEQGRNVIASQKQAADDQLETVKQAAAAQASASAQPPQEGVGDFLRGAEVSLKQLPQLGYGVAGLIGATAEKLTGFGGGLKDWGFQGYKEAEEKAAPLQRENDDVSKAWAKAKTGDVGALVDWAQYGLGYALGQMGETVAVSALGGLAGAAAGAETGPGAVVTGAGGAVAAGVAKGAFKTAVTGLVEKAIAKQALSMAEKSAAKAGVEVAAENIAKLAASPAMRKAAAKEIGSNVAVMSQALGMELGSIYPEAEKQARAEGRELTGTDLARVWGMGIAAGGVEGLTDKLGIDLLKGKFSDVLPKGRIAAAAVGGLADAAVEGGTEVFQTGMERLGARQSLTDAEAQSDYLNSGAMGALGGAAVGGVGGAWNHEKDSPAAASINEHVNTSLASIDPEAAPAAHEEIAKASLITSPTAGADGLADGVLIERELAQVEADDEASVAAADQAVTDATASGDKVAIKAAELARENLQTGRADTTRAILKIAAGQQLDDLTAGELAGIGMEETKTGFKPMKDAPVIVRTGADGSIILTDDALKTAAAVSPRARGRVKMSEAEAIQKAKKRASQSLSTDTPNDAQGDPAMGSPASAGGSPLETKGAVEFDVPMRDGTVLRVQASDASTALEEAASVAPITGQPATLVAGKPASVGTAPKSSNSKGNPAKTNEKPSKSAPLVDDSKKPSNSKGSSATTNENTLTSTTGAKKPRADGKIPAGPGWPEGLELKKHVVEVLDGPLAGLHAVVGLSQGSAHVFDPKTGYSTAIENGNWRKYPDQKNPEAKALLDAVKDGGEMDLRMKALRSESQAKTAEQYEGIGLALDRIDEVKKNKSLAARLIEGNERAITRPDGIVINPRLIIDEALDRGMSQKQAAEYFNRVLDEEIRHLAQYDAAKLLYRSQKATGPFLEWMQAHYAGIWQSEFIATGKDKTVSELYAGDFDSKSDGDKALEAIRMMSQGENVTEAAKLWLNIGETLRQALTAALAALKQFSAIASPALQTEITNLENALRTLTGVSKQDRPNSRNSQKKQAQTGRDTGADQAAEAPGAVTPAIESGTGETRRDAPVSSPLAVGARIEFVRDGERLTGKVTFEGDKAVRVQLDDGKLVNGMDKVMVFKADETLKVLAAPEDLAGEKIDKEWVAYSEESHSLGIPRAEMPQIHSTDRSAMVQFLKARGIDYVEEEVLPATLKPTQLEYSPAKVQKAREHVGGNRALLISDDGHLVDGHHQWMAALDEPESPVRVIRLMAPIREILDVIHDMPSVGTADGQQNSTGKRIVPASDVAPETLVEPPVSQVEGENTDAVGERAPAPAKVAKRRRRSVNASRIQEIFGNNPFVMSVMAQGGMMSASRARKEMGAAWWSENSSLYDDAPTFSNPTFNAIYSKSGFLTPDKIADGIAADGFMPTGDVNRMWAEIRKAAESTTNQNKQVGKEIEKQGVAVKQAEAFAEKNQDRIGSMGLQVGDFEVGHVVTVDGVEMTVESNDGETVVLADGDRFGKQSLSAEDAVWMDADNSDSFLGDEELESLTDQVIDEAQKKGYESPHELLDTTPELVESTQADTAGTSSDASEAGGPDGSVPSQDAQESRGNEVGGWQTRNSRLGDEYAKAKRQLAAAEKPWKDALEEAENSLPPGFKTIPYEGDMVALQDSDGNDIRYPLTLSEAINEAWTQTGRDDRYAKADKLEQSPEIAAARQKLKEAGEAWTANGDHPQAEQIRQEMADREAAEQRQREAVAKGKRTKAANVAAKKSAPTSKMDIRNADSKELFADDGGFKLGQDSTVDGDKVVAARKAKEEAKAAMDAAQGDIFAQPAKPALTPGKQALKDAFSDMVDGLEAAPLVTAGFYNSKGIPREKRAVFMDVADKLYDEGIRTPDALAAALEEVGGGKLRAYSDAVWSVLRSNYPELPQAGDWAGIYSKISDPTSNDTASSTSLESDRGNAGSPDTSGEGGVQPERGPTRGNGKRVVSDGNENTSPSDRIQPDNGTAAPERVGSDQPVSERPSEPEIRNSSTELGDGSREPDASGVEAYGRGEDDTHDGLVLPASAGTLAQGGVEGLSAVVGVKQSVPSLKVEQAEDVVFVEKRLLEKGKPGVLLTNGTGTGKTFSGLGVVKRALDRGEKHVIIIAPSDKVVNDWIDTAQQFFNIPDIAQLEGIKDNSSAHRVVVTTYANFGQNNELVRRPWGLVVTDEAHYLSQAKDGTSTLAQKTFKGLTWHPKEGVGSRVAMEMAEELEELASIRKSIDVNSRLMNRDDTMDQMVGALRDENRALEKRQNELSLKVENRRTELKKIAAGMKEADRPKALFLSATPFAYHFSLDYAEGYLFEHGPEPTSNAYNTPSARGKFFMENFGYRMRYGKLTQPENATATGILERMFAEKLKRDGAMRGRMLQVPFDYSRDFVLAESKIGTKVDEVIDLIRGDKRFEPLRSELEIGDYLARRYLLEGLKAREAVKRINAHLALGRKVVVFHDYKKNNATNPLRLSGGDEATRKAYNTLRSEFPGFDALVSSLDGLHSPIDVIRANFPDAGFFNGNEPKRKRRDAVKEFNRSGGKMNVILAQRAAGKEGISLHDIDGKHQRAFIDLGIPGRPTDAIQSEGRTIRLGMQSNGVIEYLTTGTNFERWTFAQTIATRASTAENLAMGENARSLLQSFSSGYNEARAVRPSTEQGTGGKKADAARESGDPFDNAVALYFTNQKKTSRNKASEGVDYFATPEPLGFKMVEWANIRPGERVLEPSGGHGAIARFFPDSTTRHAVEPSYELAGRLALNAPDTKIHQVPFEDFDLVNKFDAIVMNPPFGTAGKTAMDHLEKAVKHLKDGGRVVALIPQGSSMEKRFDKWYEAVEGVFLTAEIKLPSVTFERAGTTVSARIVILDKVKAEDARQQVSRDFTSASSTKDLFERIKDSSVPDRPEPAIAKTPAEMMGELLQGGRAAKIPSAVETTDDFSPREFTHTRDGHTVFVAKINRPLNTEEYSSAKSAAKRHGGNYSSFRGAGAIPGFHFRDAESRDGFIGSVSTDTGLRASPLPEAEADTFKKRVPVSKPMIDEARRQQEAFGKNVSSGKLASFGTEQGRKDQDVVDAFYEYQKAVKSNADAVATARQRLAADPAYVSEKLLKAATGEDVALDAADQMAFRFLIDQRTAEAGNDAAKLEEVYSMRMGLRLHRGELGRMMQIGYDRNLTPAERALAAITDAIYTPTKRVEKYAEKLHGAKRKEFLDKAGKDRIAAVQKELAKANLTIADITGKNSKLQLANSELMKKVLKLKKALDQDIIKMVQAGAAISDIKRRYGKEAAEQAQAIADTARAELFAKIKALAASGMSRDEIRKQMEGGLNAAPIANAVGGMTDEEIMKMIEDDFGIPKVIPLTNIPKGRKPKAPVVNINPFNADWSRPEFTDGMNSYQFDTRDRAGIMNRVEIIRGLAGAMGKISSLTGDQQEKAKAALKEIDQILSKYGTDAKGIFSASKGVEDYGFDINDINQVAAVSRIISMLDADWIDKASEVLYANMLSGLQTMAVNATAIIPAAWESTVGRGVEMAINLVVRDPMSAQIGEEKYILKALGPAITRAMSNFSAGFQAQHPMFDRDVLNHEIDFEKIMGGAGYRFGGSISGKKGDIIRLPMRLLSSTDDFNRTLMACVEVGTFAYRMAKAQGLKPGTPEFDRFLKVQVNTPGSMAYELAAVKASRAIFSNPLPGQMDPTTGKVVGVHDLGDMAGWAAASLTKFAAKEHDNLFVKASQAALRICFFPFQRTPFNILRQGVRYTLNPFSLFDIGLGVVQNSMGTNPDGSIKWKWNAKGRNPELVSRMGKQLQGAMLMMLLAAAGAGEGDDDDQDKPFVITGSAPFTPQGRAERDAAIRSGIGPYRISFRRKDGSERFGFNYGRLEPLATTLAATIDLMKSVKRADRSGKGGYDAAAEALGGLASQAQDKSFMKGISDLVALATNLTAQPDLQENRKFQQFLAGRVAMVIPNIIKQPIREADGLYRERSNSFMQEMLYQIAPAGQKEAKVDPYGRPAEKTGTAAGRIIDVTDAGTDKVHPVDAMLLRFRDKHPGDSWFPAPIISAEFKHPKTGQNVKMNEAQLSEFRTLAGKRADAILKREVVNFTNPSMMDVEKVKKAVSQARTDMKKALAFKFAR